MRFGTRWFLAAGFVACAALVASGCGGCPVCNFFKRTYQSITGCGPAATEPAKPGAQTTCPVLGGRINKRLYVDYEGKRIYVCCAGCIAKIRSDPAKYVQQLEAKGVVLDRVPVTQ